MYASSGKAGDRQVDNAPSVAHGSTGSGSAGSWQAASRSAVVTMPMKDA